MQIFDEISPVKKDNGNAKAGVRKKQQSVFPKQSTIQDAATEASFMVSYKLAKRNKPFSESEFIKECMSDVAIIMCPEQKTKTDSIALSSQNVVRRIEKISNDLMSQLKDTSKLVCVVVVAYPLP